ncbi:MAG: NEW3 domain-containing protein [Candidatus Aenigmatarchaeota archaeon]
MPKQKMIMRSVFAVLLFVFILIPSASAKADGRIYQLAYSPTEPAVLEDIKISVGVENPSDKTQNYFMQVQVVKDGKPVHEQVFAFSVAKGKQTQFTLLYPPEAIGEHQVVARLYDNLKINLISTEIITFNAVSYLGPFDIIIEPLTSRLRPDLRLPAKLILENMGAKGTDVEVRISVDCENPITQSLTTFVPSHAKIEKLITSPVCENEGLHEISAEILIFNRTWVSSTSQFVVNSSFVQLQFEVPENITLQPGQSFTFPIEVTNVGNQKISDLKFVIERIPLDWQKTTPTSLKGVESNETAIFLVNITVPVDAQADSYEIRMTVTAYETIEKKNSVLNVVNLAAYPETQTTVQPVTKSLVSVAIYLLLAAIVLVVAALLKKHLNQRSALKTKRYSYPIEKLREQINHKTSKPNKNFRRK